MVKYAVALMVALGFSLPVLAGGSKIVAPAPKIMRPPPIKVDPGLLEFLGAWETSDGQAVDPMMFASINPVQLEAAHARAHGKSQPPAGSSPKSDSGNGSRGEASDHS